jgi:alpha-L-fucosidase
MNRRTFLQGAAAVLAAARLPELSVGENIVDADKAASTAPSPGQQAMIARGYGMFMHFGINTFNQCEWSDGTLPVSSYNPTSLDCNQWIATAKEAGFRHVIVITKHHDGFCMWPTKHTDYCVTSSPVKTDVVGEVARACRKHGVQLGLYYSLWDRHEPTHREKSSADYVQYMKHQLSELLTEYGDVCEIWFDGAWAKPDAEWDVPGLSALIKKLRPNCQVGVNHTIAMPGKPHSICQPVDYQTGYPIRFWPTDFRLKDPNLPRWDDPKLYKSADGQLRYLPFETTICLSDRWNWFQKKDVMPTRSLDELEELFYWCTSNDNTFIVNVPPDQTGRLRQNEIDAIFALADRLGIRGGKTALPKSPPKSPLNQAFGVPATASSVWQNNPEYGPDRAVDTSLETRWASEALCATLELSPAEPFVFNRISIMEYPDTTDLGDSFSQRRDFRIQAYTIDVLQNGSWRTIDRGSTIGATKIIRLKQTETADRVRIAITEASKPPSLFHVSISKV